MRSFCCLFVLFLFVQWSVAAPVRSWSTPQQSSGDVRIYVEQDTVTGMPLAIGLRLSESNVYQPPEDASTMYFEMPVKAQRVTPFIEIDFDYEPATKKAAAKYEVYFYMTAKGGSLSRITPGPCDGVSIEGYCRSTQLLPAACCPAGFMQSAQVEPFVGSKLLFPPDFSVPFSKTFMFGTLDSMIHYFAIGVTLDFLVNSVQPAGSVCTNIPSMPSEFKFGGYYPTTYCFTYSTNYGAYFIELTNFVPYLPGCKGVANSCAPPSSVDLPKKCNCNKAFPSFVPVAPPAGTGISGTTTTSASTHDHTSSSSGSSASTHTSGSSHTTMSTHTSEHTTMSTHTSEHTTMTSMSTHEGHSNMTNTTTTGSEEDMGFLVLIAQPSIHLLYMISLAIIGFFFLIIAISFSLYGTTVSIALIRAEKNNRQLSLILKMIFITGLLTCIFAARCALIIWEDLVHRHVVDSNYLWRSYFLPEIIPALLILLLDVLQVFNEKKKAIAASMATLGFTSKTRDSSTAATRNSSQKTATHSAGSSSADASSHSAH